MLTETDVLTMWRKLFQEPAGGGKTLAKAEKLLEKLRPESPLRLRLATELAEIRKVAKPKK